MSGLAMRMRWAGVERDLGVVSLVTLCAFVLVAAAYTATAVYRPAEAAGGPVSTHLARPAGLVDEESFAQARCQRRHPPNLRESDGRGSDAQRDRQRHLCR